LCSDLPSQHFLKKGATYRLLGADSSPQLLDDPDEWSGAAPLRVSLDSASPLAVKICNKSNPNNAPCIYSVKVVLDEDLACGGVECNLNDVRTIELEPGIWYEYVRPPCVHRAFYEDPKSIRRDYGSDKYMCGDPLIETASTTCCEEGTDSNTNTRVGVELFSGERVAFDVANQRCEDAGKRLCSNPDISTSDCENTSIGGCDRYGVHYWSVESCNLSAKIDKKGSVAIVHESGSSRIRDMVLHNTKMFFRVDWVSSNEDVDIFLSDYASKCEGMGCVVDTSDGVCQCGVSSVTETDAFTDDVTLENASVEEILSTVTIGAYPPSPTVDRVEVAPGVWKYPAGSLTSSTIFEIVDANGIPHFRRNVKSVVTVGSLSFRNPVHFISIADPNIRDAQYETDAALEHYFYHPNTAPFLAIRLAQRFGISNPSPRYIEAITTAFRTGIYSDGSTSIGSGEYGDMQATVAAILLDRESQDILLDADPVQ
jgi:hypothetical protein